MKEEDNHFNCRSCSNFDCKLKVLNNEELSSLKEFSTTLDATTGTTLFIQNAPPTHIIYVKKGLVQITSQRTNKSKNILNIYSQGCFLGIQCALANRKYMYSAKTLTSTQLCYISIPHFKTLLQQNPVFSYQVLLNVSSESIKIHEQLQTNYELHLPGKIAKTLLHFSTNFYNSSSFELPVSKTELSCYIGASRERVSKVLNQFTSDRIIDMHGNHININNMELLVRLSQVG